MLSELPTVLTGAVSLILLKALTTAAATRVPRWLEPNRLEAADAVKLAFLLSGGGEFALVVLALAEKLEVLPKDLGGLITAIANSPPPERKKANLTASGVSRQLGSSQRGNRVAAATVRALRKINDTAPVSPVGSSESTKSESKRLPAGVTKIMVMHGRNEKC